MLPKLDGRVPSHARLLKAIERCVPLRQAVTPRGKMSIELFAPEGERLANLETSKIDELAAGLEKALEEFETRPARVELVFSFRAVTPADRRAVEARLRELSSDDIATRDGAERALVAMGGPAIVVLAGIDRAKLDEDGAGRVNRVLERQQRRDGSAHRDVPYLLSVKDARGRERLTRILAALKPPGEAKLPDWWAVNRDFVRWNAEADRYEWAK